MMERLISYPISVVYYLSFGLVLVIFHPIQWLCLHLSGYEAHKRSVDFMNLILIGCSRMLFTRYTIIGKDKIPLNAPLIFASNHQSLYDIIGLIWFFRAYHIKYVSKKELGKGIPSVSFNLRHGGSVLIDRKDPKQALPAIKSLGEYIEKHQRSASIFPEGTRSKNGKTKAFAPNGLKILCKSAPSAYVIPITINDSWKMTKFGVFPMGLGSALQFIVHDPIKVDSCSFEELFQQTESAVNSAIKS